MLINSIKINSLLSFGTDAPAIRLGKLNILIGHNGVGKSNLLEVIGLLRAMPGDLTRPVREGGGIREWLWKGRPSVNCAFVEVLINNPGHTALRHCVQITDSLGRLEIESETIENSAANPEETQVYFFYKNEKGHPVLNVKQEKRYLRREDVSFEQSILAQRKDPDQYPELSYIGDNYSKIRLYREWQFGRYTPPRLPQRADLPNLFLEEDASNLGLILNRLRREVTLKKRFLEALQVLYAEIEDFDVSIEGSTVQVFFQENGMTIPSTRLSDGTLRYLALLAILLHPTPPPLVCIEEPELGLHPDILPTLVDLLKDASERMQLLVTTHSADLIDEFSDAPECVLVCEKQEGSTVMQRQSRDDLAVWLEKYRLGQLWRRGDIGGNRW
jgi:predicted ATPase